MSFEFVYSRPKLKIINIISEYQMHIGKEIIAGKQ